MARCVKDRKRIGGLRPNGEGRTFALGRSRQVCEATKNGFLLGGIPTLESRCGGLNQTYLDGAGRLAFRLYLDDSKPTLNEGEQRNEERGYESQPGLGLPTQPRRTKSRVGRG